MTAEATFQATLTFTKKTENTVTCHWIARDIKSCLLINMNTMCKTRGGHTSERDKIGKKQWTSDAKNRKKDEIWYYSQVAKVRPLDRVWQFTIDSQQTILIWRETDVSRGTGMCLNMIFNLYIACVKYMYINSGIYSRV